MCQHRQWGKGQGGCTSPRKDVAIANRIGGVDEGEQEIVAGDKRQERIEDRASEHTGGGQERDTGSVEVRI